MIPQGANDRERFLDAVRQFPALWRSVDLRIVAVRRPDGWHNVHTRVVLRGPAPRAIPRLASPPATPQLKAWHVVAPLASLDRIVHQIAEGELTVGRDRVRYLRRDGNPGTPWTPHGLENFHFHDALGPYAQPGVRWTHYALAGRGAQQHDLYHDLPGERQGLDDLVRRLDPPYRTIADLITRFVGVTPQMGSSDNATVSFLAPIEVSISADGTRLVGDELVVVVEAGDPAAARCVSLQIVAPAGDPSTIPLGPWREEGDVLRTEVRCHVGTADPLSLILRVPPLGLQWVDVRNYSARGHNPRLAAHEVFDADLAHFREELHPRTAAQRKQFELAVTRLFGFLGFQVDVVTGDSRLGDAVDVLAHAPGEHTCVAIECTTGSINTGGKLGKFVKRLAELRRALPAVRVVGVVAAPSPGKDFSIPELREAAADGLRLVDDAALHTLLALAERSAAPAEVLAYLETCHPPVMPEGGLARMLRGG